MGDLERSTERADRLRTGTYQTARDRFSQTMESAIERAERRRLEREKAKAEAALAAQQAAAVERRDKKQNLYETGRANQNANISANAAAQQNAYATQRDQFQQQGTLKRDDLQNRFTSQRDKQQALDQQRRDERQFGYSTQENAQQQANTLERDAFQNQYATQRDQTQFGQQLQRDFTQFGLDSRRQDQQQQNTLERDVMQGGIQAQRDNRMNQFDTQRDVRQNQFQTERDVRQDRFQTQGDIRQQQFQQQNLTQRETADIRDKWNDRVQQARSAGFEFSPAQQKEMKEMEASFLKNVLNNRDLDESTRQGAMLQYQQKLSAFLPQDKVVSGKDQLAQRIQFDDRLPGVPFMMGVDAKGNPTFEPLGTGGGGQDPQKAQEAERKAAEKQAVELRTMKRDRDKLFQQTHREVINEIDADSNKVFTDPDAIDKEVMNRLAADEIYYVESGLPPHDLFRASAEKEQQKAGKYKNAQQNPQGPPQTQANPYRSETMDSASAAAQDPVNLWRQKIQRPVQSQMPVTNQQQPASALPAPSSSPSIKTSSNIDDQLKKTAQDGDREANVALDIIKRVIAKGGPPKEGSQELADVIAAYRILAEKGISIDDLKKPQTRPSTYDKDYVFPGM